MTKTNSILIFISFAFFSCSSGDNKERRVRRQILHCLDLKLANIKNSETYKTAFAQANHFYEIQKDSEKVFTEIKVPVKRTFDKYVFFSQDTTHCVLMLLEEYPENFEIGYVRIILGQIVNKAWKFHVGMEISFPPEDIEPLFPEEYKNGVRRYNIDMLSQRARIGVLNHGSPSIKKCDFDEEWWLENQF